LAPAIKKAFNVPVVCTLQGEDGYLDSLPSPYREESWQLLHDLSEQIDRYIAVSYYYGELMRDRLRVGQKKIRVVQNGISLEGYDFEVPSGKRPIVGYLARFSRDKGFHTLAEAFIRLKQNGHVEGVRFHAAGTATPSDEGYIGEVRERLESSGYGEAVTLRTNISREEKIEFLRDLAVFSVPATYGESFGLYVLEALAAGVPVVQPDSGGFTELLEATGGGILTHSGQPEEIASALESLLLDPEKARELGEKGRQVVREKFSLERMTRDVLRVLEEALSAYK
jgi:glycosyltransferase involved in cell wall biosynthesis